VLRKKTHEEFLRELKDKDIKYIPIDKYKGYHEKIRFQCYNNKKHVFDMSPSDILRNHNCPFCTGHTSFKGETDIWTMNPELGKLLLHNEDGFNYTQYSNQKADFKCPNCNHIIKDKIIANISKHGLSCPICCDGESYGEKFIASLLKQLNIEFKHDISLPWSNNRRYDFYLCDYNMIIEVNGIQHYSKSFKGIGANARNLNEEKENDEYKKQLAMQNGINEADYISLDARESNMNYIKHSILISCLSTQFDLSNINWAECNINSHKSVAIEVANCWNSGIKNTKKLSDIYDKNLTTIISYLKNLAEIGFCDYKPYYQTIGVKHSKDHNDSQKKKVLCIETGKIYNSILETGKYGFCSSSVSMCCNNKQKMAGGYHWSFLIN
jgi:ribosomal protein L37AE/L43A